MTVQIKAWVLDELLALDGAKLFIQSKIFVKRGPALELNGAVCGVQIVFSRRRCRALGRCSRGFGFSWIHVSSGELGSMRIEVVNANATNPGVATVI